MRMSVEIPDYAELHAISNYTFLTGASHPEELLQQANALGYKALALTDECSFAGVVRAHVAAKALACQLIIGTQLTLTNGLRCVLLASDRAAYAALCRLITQARRAADKGHYLMTPADLCRDPLPGVLCLWLPNNSGEITDLQWLRERFDDLWVAVEAHATGSDRAYVSGLLALAASVGIPAVASGNVYMHQRQRQSLQDVLTAIRLAVPIESLGLQLHSNAERHLQHRAQLARRYPLELLRQTVLIAERCHFNLDTLRYEYPSELVPTGQTAGSWLSALTSQGMRLRWPDGAPTQVRQLVARELALISELQFEAYFLTVEDLVRFAKARGILCQGRGSAANSAVCYCLGITEVDPARMAMLFERFVSKERNEPPDIDVDFEHERREEVIQYLYTKYGRHRAALTGVVIRYRPRSALRDVGRALGLPAAMMMRLGRSLRGWDGADIDPIYIREAGLDPASPVVTRLLLLSAELIGFPRHLSQHVGGFVIARDSLDALVPIENAAMPERTVIQWDKDDLDDLGILKVDVLALGMLSAIRRTLALMSARHGRVFQLADVPAEDPTTYAMISKADTVGVFQIESRAQMAMLPRLAPKCYYDLVIEVALVRPGPIQGNMVHPYLRRRMGLEPVLYPSEAVREVLSRTLGVPIFQEQVMQLAIVAAGFSAGEADQLRRAMAAWKRRGGLGAFESRLIDGMRARGYTEEFAQAIFRQILGFGDYGFPEAHAASFALIVYISAWLKCHEPAAFTVGLLNSQPMGFYAPAQLVRDAREHGVNVRGVDVLSSEWECTLEGETLSVIRLGLMQVRGFGPSAAARLINARQQHIFSSVEDLAARADLSRHELAALADSGALAALAGHRHLAVWAVTGIERPVGLLVHDTQDQATPLLKKPTEGADIVADYRSLGLTLGRHPLALLRTRLNVLHCLTAQAVHHQGHGAAVVVAGLVLTRQRPGSAGGVVFVTLEDETGVVNLIIWQRIAARFRRQLLNAQLLGAIGTVQRVGEVVHVCVERLVDHTRALGQLSTAARNFH